MSSTLGLRCSPAALSPAALWSEGCAEACASDCPLPPFGAERAAAPSGTTAGAWTRRVLPVAEKAHLRSCLQRCLATTAPKPAPREPAGAAWSPSSLPDSSEEDSLAELSPSGVATPPRGP